MVKYEKIEKKSDEIEVRDIFSIGDVIFEVTDKFVNETDIHLKLRAISVLNTQDFPLKHLDANVTLMRGITMSILK